MLIIHEKVEWLEAELCVHIRHGDIDANVRKALLSLVVNHFQSLNLLLAGIQQHSIYVHKAKIITRESQ